MSIGYCCCILRIPFKCMLIYDYVRMMCDVLCTYECGILAYRHNWTGNTDNSSIEVFHLFHLIFRLFFRIFLNFPSAQDQLSFYPFSVCINWFSFEFIFFNVFLIFFFFVIQIHVYIDRILSINKVILFPDHANLILAFIRFVALAIAVAVIVVVALAAVIISFPRLNVVLSVCT